MFEKLPVREKPVDKASEAGELYSANTVKVYQANMNKLSKATGFETVKDLLIPGNQQKIVKYLDSLPGNNYTHRVAYSAVFYSIGPKQSTKDIKPLYDAFQKWKKPEEAKN